MLDSSDLLLPKTLLEVDDGFLEPELAPRRLYFLNSQKLSKTSRLVQSGTNQRQLSFWDVLAGTIDGEKANLYLILDEAHRGMKRSSDRKTIVQRLIHGEKGSNPAVPVVWGISATIDRFTKAMGEIRDRTVYPHVVVDIDEVRASGLVKDEIGLDQPEEKGTFSTTPAARCRDGYTRLRGSVVRILRFRARVEGAPGHGGTGSRQVERIEDR